MPVFFLRGVSYAGISLFGVQNNLTKRRNDSSVNKTHYSKEIIVKVTKSINVRIEEIDS